MNKLLIPIATLAIIMLPAAANAAQCRDSATGKYAKCGAPGAVPASQYVAKGKTTAKPKPAMASTMTMPMPAATPTKSAKPGLMSMFKPKPKPTPAARCKDAKSKFVKCGTPGAKPV